MNYNLLNFCENDKYATKSYCAVHGVDDSMNLGDITKVDIEGLPTDVDFITFGSPCTDISIQGKQKGASRDDKTNSSLLWKAIDIISHCKPKFVLWENVPNIMSKRHIGTFNDMLNTFQQIGYNTYYKLLDSKYYESPQQRKRLYMLAVRTDVDVGFTFPTNSIPTKQRLSDILCENPDEKFYVNCKEYKNLITNDDTNDVCPHQIGQIYGFSKEKNPQAGRVYDMNFISPTLDRCSGGNKMPKILENGKVRKLTPKECWRLMGFDDEDFEKAAKHCSATQLYKQAGNSIVVNVLEAIYKNLADTNHHFKEGMNVLSLFSGIGAFEKALRRFDE